MNFGKVQKRRGIGTVITTLIVLIASVVLGAGVIFFGGSLFQTNTQAESIKVSNSHIWVANNSTSTAAFVVQNTGGKAVTVNSVTIRGISVPTSDWFYNIALANATNIQRELVADYTESTVNINGAVGEEAMVPLGPISLNQGQAAIVYLHNPASLTSLDAGNAMTVQIQAGQAQAVQSVSAISKN